MTQKTTFNIVFSLIFSAIAPCYLKAQGEIRGRVVTRKGEAVVGMQIQVSGAKANPVFTKDAGNFSITVLDKNKIGITVRLEFSHESYALVKGSGYVWMDDKTAGGNIVVMQPGESQSLTFFATSKAIFKETGKKTADKTLAFAEKKANESEQRSDLESKQYAFYLKQNKKRLAEYSERVNSEIQSEDNATKSKAYLDAYNAVYVKGDFDEAFKALNDNYIDANLNAAKEKYRAAGSDESKKKAAKADMDKAIGDCVMKARLCVMLLEYDKAVDYYRKAVFTNQDDIAIRDEFANFLNLIGKGYKDTYEFPKARRAFQEAVDIREKLVKEDLGNEEYQYFKLLEAQNSLITLFREFNQMNEAVEVYAEAESTILKYLDFLRRDNENPDPEAKKKKEDKKKQKESQFKDNDDEKLLVLAQLYSNLGSINILRKDYRVARSQFESALEIFGELRQRDAIKKNQINLELAQTCTNLGILYTEWYKSTDFLEWEENPINAPGWFELANQYYDQVKDESLSLAKSGKANNYHQWARMYHKIWEKNPNNKTYAENYFKKVDQAYEELSAENPKMFVPRRIKVLCDMFDFYITVKNVDRANLTIFKKLSEAYEKNKNNNINLDAFTPELADMLNHLGWIYHNKAKEEDPLHLDMAFMNQAKAWFDESKKEYERLDRMNDNIFLPKKAYCYINLSYYYYSLHYAEPLNETKRTGLEYAEKAIADLDKYFDYHKKISKGTYKDFEAEQYMKYAREIKAAFEKFSVTKKTVPKIVTYNIYYPK